MPLKPSAIKIRQLTVNYEKTPILWDVSLEIPQGVIVGMVGPNGAGKSTLMQAMMGFVHPLAGSVQFFNKPLSEVRKRVAYVPQKEKIDWDFPITVLDLVLMGRYPQKGLFKWMTKADRQAAMRCLEMVKMEAFAHRQISQLSGGQQQRAFIARALLQEAELYLLDEPFAGVDLATENMLMDLFRKMREAGKTIWIVHHDLKTVSTYFDWVAILNLSLIAVGPVDEVFNEETLSRAYGKGHVILSEVGRLSREKRMGAS